MNQGAFLGRGSCDTYLSLCWFKFTNVWHVLNKMMQKGSYHHKGTLNLRWTRRSNAAESFRSTFVLIYPELSQICEVWAVGSYPFALSLDLLNVLSKRQQLLPDFQLLLSNPPSERRWNTGRSSSVRTRAREFAVRFNWMYHFQCVLTNRVLRSSFRGSYACLMLCCY